MGDGGEENGEEEPGEERDRSRDEARSAATTAVFRREGKPLVLLQVNCRCIYNKALDFWNLVDTIRM
jgi:hypothetical protein